MNKFTYILSIVVALLFVGGCGSAKHIDSVYATNNFETQCLRQDGAIVNLRAWGKGKDKGEALKQCRKQALRDVMFKGVYLGSSIKPLVTAVNAEEKNREFFNKFFADNGDWSKFAKLDEKSGSRMVAKSSVIENWNATVAINTDALKTYLQKNNIIQ